jgi:hypothetical protein
MSSRSLNGAFRERLEREVVAGPELAAAAEAARQRLKALSEGWRRLALPYVGRAPEPQADFRWIEDGGRSR